MKKLLRKPAMVICASALFIAGAAVSYASFKERSNAETKDVLTSAPEEIAPAESIEPVGNQEVQTVTKPNLHDNTYEEQAAAIQDRQSRRNEQAQSVSTE